MVRPAFDVEQLTISERLELIDRLWESLRALPEGLPMTKDEGELIATRRAAHRADSSTAVHWESVRAELEADQEMDDNLGRLDASGES